MLIVWDRYIYWRWWDGKGYGEHRSHFWFSASRFTSQVRFFERIVRERKTWLSDARIISFMRRARYITTINYCWLSLSAASWSAPLITSVPASPKWPAPPIDRQSTPCGCAWCGWFAWSAVLSNSASNRCTATYWWFSAPFSTTRWKLHFLLF